MAKRLDKMNLDKKYHLWLGYYDSIERYEQYIGTDNVTGTSPLAIDLNMPHKDKEMDTAGGLTCLQPDLNHHFPLPELLFDTPVLHTDIEKIGSLKPLQNPKTIHLFWGFHYFNTNTIK